ncbi:MAG TPA: phosphatase PAP2 family protein [Lysobacter sp.]
MTPPVLDHSANGFAAPPAVAQPAAVAASWRPDFRRSHLQWPLFAWACVFFVATVLHGDLWLADRLYAFEGGTWALHHSWVTEHLIHHLGREASTAAWLAAFAAWLVACSRSGWTHLRLPLLYLLVATALSTLLVSWMKTWSNVDCPWDVARYGGAHAYVGLFQWRPAGMGQGQCFPAGHASGGYAWLALYFFLMAVKPRLRWLGLAAGLCAGLLFGISQQLRGAHFLSHDLATLAICWTCAVELQRVFWRPRADARASMPPATSTFR